MSDELKLMKLESRMALLRGRGETMNGPILKKLERKRRQLVEKINATK